MFPEHVEGQKLAESFIETTAANFGVHQGWLTRKLGWIGRDGAPDRIFMRDGRVLFVEFKATGKKPTKIQEREHERLRAAGMRVEVVDNLADVYRLLRRGSNA